MWPMTDHPRRLGARPTRHAAAPEHLRRLVVRAGIHWTRAGVRQLQAAFNAAVAGQGTLVAVLGEPGIGKTSLCEQLATVSPQPLQLHAGGPLLRRGLAVAALSALHRGPAQLCARPRPGPQAAHYRHCRVPLRTQRLARPITRPITELTAPIPISMPAVSRHLKVLEHAALISRTRSGKWRASHLEAGLALGRKQSAHRDLSDGLRKRLGPPPFATPRQRL
jgi:DNA-binding transcriptional ArsR family regulator